MLVREEVCVGCGRCQPYCPEGAISYKGLKSFVDQDACVECGTCLRVGICPVDALMEHPQVFDYPRALRKFFSDPTATHAATGISGRGTEESKTNDVTNRVGPDEVGIAIEVGRPTLGMTLHDVQKISRALAKAGITEIEECNPIHSMYSNPDTGDLKPELLDEKVLSAIIEMSVPFERAAAVLRTAKEVAKELDSVFTLDIFSTLGPNLTIQQRVLDLLEAEGLPWRPNAKINMGLGRLSK
ncbi:MAG: 4Fe-4S binding protein [Rhodospirillales bacterium]|jgi:NAD-dependent dihydropyrimidine dehydrogenase PreA subunit|nr:4Fe-4S binding protein [Rhodospirillales bacterium]